MPDIFVPTNKDAEADHASVVPDKVAQVDNQNSNEHKSHDTQKDQMGILTSICENPKGINFINQESDEKIILFVRQHFITNLRWIISSIIALILPPIIGVILSTLQIELISAPSQIVVALILFYYLVLIGYVFTSFLHWFFNIGIVTEKRMIDIDYSNILHKNIASVHLAEVIDTEIIQRGFLQGHFNYGDILIQTVGIKPNFEFLAAPNPAHVSDIIHDRLLTVKKRL